MIADIVWLRGFYRRGLWLRRLNVLAFGLNIWTAARWIYDPGAVPVQWQALAICINIAAAVWIWQIAVVHERHLREVAELIRRWDGP